MTLQKYKKFVLPFQKNRSKLAAVSDEILIEDGAKY